MILALEKWRQGGQKFRVTADDITWNPGSLFKNRLRLKIIYNHGLLVTSWMGVAKNIFEISIQSYFS